MPCPARLQERVKTHITDLMLSAPPRVRAQLSEALSIISSHDFPARWQTLLPHLVDKMASPDQQLVNGVLSTADSIYQRYRHGICTRGCQGWLDCLLWASAGCYRCARCWLRRPHAHIEKLSLAGIVCSSCFCRALSTSPALLCLRRLLCRGQFMTDKLSDELQYSQALVQPLLACLQSLSKKVAELAAAGEGAVEALRLVLSNVQLVASIFYSLNSPGLTDVREWEGGAAACYRVGFAAVAEGSVSRAACQAFAAS